MNKRGIPILIVAALLLLAGGIIWAVRTSQNDDSSPLLQSEVTQTVSPQPSLSLTPPQPTPSPEQGTPPAIDTSAWLTYTSPYHGFSIKYPPDWTLQAPGHKSQPVYVRNPQFMVANEQRRAVGIKAHFTPQLGEAWFQAVAGPPGQFDVEALSTICGGSTTETSLKAFRAALCSSGTMWVERPDGGILQIAIENVGQDLRVALIIETIRGTLTFDQE